MLQSQKMEKMCILFSWEKKGDIMTGIYCKLEATASLLLVSTDFGIIHLLYDVIWRTAWEFWRKRNYVLVGKANTGS